MYYKPVATINELSELANLSVQSINSTIKILTADGILKEITVNKRNSVFTLEDYVNVFM